MIFLEQLQQFFDTAHWPKQKESKPTFFSIAGFPHYENVLSNIYKFFFNTENPHELGSLCIDALIDIIRSKGVNIPWDENSFRRAYSIREVTVNNSQRLDILIHNGVNERDWSIANAAILIENKVYHWLANDLNNYWDSINSAELSDKKIGVVLGLRPEKVSPPWYYISHAELAQAIERRLGPALYRAEPRYVTLLLELIENTHNMSKSNKEFEDLLRFFQGNRIAISQAEKIRSQVFHQFPEEVKKLIPSDYHIFQNAEARRDGWLLIKRRNDIGYNFVLGYHAIFHNDEEPSYRIELHSNPPNESTHLAKINITASEHVQKHHIEEHNEENYHMVGKTYYLSSQDYNNLPYTILEKLEIEWFPLEQYWISNSDLH